MFSDANVGGFSGQGRVENLDVLKRDVGYIVFYISTFELHQVFAAHAGDLHVLESDIVDEPWYLLAHVLIDNRFKSNETPLAFAVDADILDADVFQSHILTWLEQKRRHGEMHDVKVLQSHVTHVLCTALVAQQKDASPVAPEC